MTRSFQRASAAAFVALAGVLVLAAPQPTPPVVFMPVADVTPGMIGTGRTVYAGTTLEDFQVQIIGTLNNAVGPRRPLILAKLSGGRLAETGVIAGMSGSPVYIDGKLVGAVSYALGQFSKEPIAGITPIGEMISDIDSPGAATRAASTDLALPKSPTTADVFAALRRLMDRAAAPLSPLPAAIIADANLSSGLLRPIGLALSMRGFDASIAGDLGATPAPADAPRGRALPQTPVTLRPGDPVGASLLRGDFEMGATGTVTYVNGTRVYAFGHPFLALGSAQMTMTGARVYTVLPSLASSMKVADLGPAIGLVSQDRASAIGGNLGVAPHEMHVTLNLVNGTAPPRAFSFFVAHDPAMTPLFAYVSMLNVLTNYQRQSGVLTVGVKGTVSFGADGRITIDDLFTGDQALVGVSNSVLGPLSAMMNNDFGAPVPESLDVTLTVSETQSGVTIERAWLDTTHPRYGATHTVHVMLRNFRGHTETRSIPVTMPASGPSAVTLLVSDAPTLAALEDKELDPNAAKTTADLVLGLNRIRRNNRLYVRLLTQTSGTIIAGRAQPGLPGSTRSVLDADKSASPSTINRAIAGAWEDRLSTVVRGSRELALTLSADIK
ncbi:MAG: SpoIVB peptidase S55 domain-containing protein [Acidobacteriota bacterium]